MLGFELAYMDFGNPSAPPPPSTLFGYFKDTSKQSATTLFAVGYLPLSVSFLDLYGKLGVARLRTDTQVSYLPPTCPADFNCNVPYTVRQNQWTSDLAYGAGAQAHFASVGVRAEYERIAASGGNPDMISLGVTWNF
jgi:opacity protein-like surface antigen